MVFKLFPSRTVLSDMFENDVKIYGIQTSPVFLSLSSEFENDVKIYGIQTADRFCTD